MTRPTMPGKEMNVSFRNHITTMRESTPYTVSYESENHWSVITQKSGSMWPKVRICTLERQRRSWILRTESISIVFKTLMRQLCISEVFLNFPHRLEIFLQNPGHPLLFIQRNNYDHLDGAERPFLCG